MGDAEEDLWAFVDEYGEANLDTTLKDVSGLFIVVLVLVPEHKLEPLRGELEEIRARYFQKGKLESKAKWLRKSNADGWKPLLGDIAELDFKFYALAVDKEQLGKDGGYRYRKSFYKNLCGQAYGRVIAAHPNVNVRADRYGGPDFKESFGKYIQDRHRPTLFSKSTFDWADEGDLLAGLADILCGLLARCFDPKKQMNGARDLLQLFSGQILCLDEWPVKFRFPAAQDGRVSVDDARIGTYCIQKAEEFVEQHNRARDLPQRCQVVVAEYLLFLGRFMGGEPAHADAINEHLKGLGLAPKTTQWLRQKVIAKLRDAGVIITSSSAGYKLPTSAEDLRQYVRHAESICVPMLARIEVACGTIKLVTSGDVDVFAEEDFATAASLVEAAKQKLV